jgi:hypothetical protein
LSFNEGVGCKNLENLLSDFLVEILMKKTPKKLHPDLGMVAKLGFRLRLWNSCEVDGASDCNGGCLRTGYYETKFVCVSKLQSDNLKGRVAGVDETSPASLYRLINFAKHLLDEPVSERNFETGKLTSISNAGTNREALYRYDALVLPTPSEDSNKKLS